MALEKLDREAKVVAYNSDADLASKNTRKNHQGVSLEDLSYIKILPGVTYAQLINNYNADPAMQKGKLLLCEESPNNFKLAIVRKSYGKFDSEPNTILANTPSAVGDVLPVDNTYQNTKAYLRSKPDVELLTNVTITGGVPTKVRVLGDHKLELAYHNWKHDFKAGDTLVIAEGWETVDVDDGEGGTIPTPASAVWVDIAEDDLVAHFMSLETNLIGDVD